MFHPQLKLLKSLSLKDFPSGSSINYYQDKLYLIGDDAREILILDLEYNVIDTIPLFNYPHKRIPKPIKVDLETSTIIDIEGVKTIVAMGSAATNARQEIYTIPLLSNNKIEAIGYETFIKKIIEKGVREINIEGSALVGKHFVIANRGNNSNPVNHLIFTEPFFWNNQSNVKLAVSELKLELKNNQFLGISELCYWRQKDVLFFTASSELTYNSYDDGIIGSSYIGWVNGMSLKDENKIIYPDSLIDLTTVDPGFERQKIEGICIQEGLDNNLFLHLVSDNDQGESCLFKLDFIVNKDNIAPF